MLSVNATPQNIGGPIRSQGYSPYLTFGIAPWSNFDKYSDGTTATDGIGILDTNNQLYVSVTAQSPFGFSSIVSSSLDASSSSILGKLNGFSPRTISNNGFKYYKFPHLVNQYRSFLKLGYYSFLKDVTPISLTQSTSLYMGILRELNSTTVIWVYGESASAAKAMAGTIASDGTISWGTVVSLDAVNNINGYEWGYATIGTDKFVVGGNYSNATGKVNVCSVSGNTITVGTATQFNATAITDTRICKLDTDKFAILYKETTGFAYSMIVATVSGTTPTFGSEITAIAGTGTENIGGLEQNGTDAFTFTYSSGSSTLLKAVAGTVSGTVPTLGSAVTIITHQAVLGQIVGNNKVLKKVNTNKFLAVISPSSGGMSLVTYSISGTTVTANTSVYYDNMEISTVQDILEVTTDTTYILYGEAAAVKVSISGGTTTVNHNYPKTVLSESLVKTAQFGAGVSVNGVGDYATYLSPSAGTVYGVCGSYVVVIGSASNSSLKYYMVAPLTTTFEAYNDGTIIGSAFTCTEPFILQSQDIKSDIYSETAFLKIKNTTGSTVGMVIETVLCEVD